MKFAVFVMCVGMTCAACAESTAQLWPHGRKAAIALTYDDSLKSQLDFVVPQLDAAGLKGTFFLMGRQVGDQVERWRAVAASGHELGNHTVNHPCARATYDMPAQYNSEAYSVDVLLTEIGVMNDFLQALDHKTSHSFATPCDQHIVGGADYLAPMQQAHLASFIRDRHTLPDFISYTGFVGKSGPDMIKWIEDVARKGGAGVIVFHGVGGDYLSVSADDHQQLVTYLKAHEQEIWTTTFSDVVSRASAAH
ncbi:MAG: polysaccharide deacetylase family protein [Povalibacter sp.]